VVVRGGEGSRPLSFACRPRKGHSGTGQRLPAHRLRLVRLQTNCLPGPMFFACCAVPMPPEISKKASAAGFAYWNLLAPLEQAAAPSMTAQLTETLQQLLLHLLQTSGVARGAKLNIREIGPRFSPPRPIRPRLHCLGRRESSHSTIDTVPCTFRATTSFYKHG